MLFYLVIFSFIFTCIFTCMAVCFSGLLFTLAGNGKVKGVRQTTHSWQRSQRMPNGSAHWGSHTSERFGSGGKETAYQRSGA